MSFEESFLYPLYLILIGGAISGVLIPSYNAMRAKRNRELEDERVEHQRETDRQREDHKQELEIKRDLIEKISQTTSRQMLLIIKHAESKNEEDSKDNDIHSEWMISGRTILSLLGLYFNKNDILIEWGKVYDILRDASRAIEKPEYEKKFLSTINMRLNSREGDKNYYYTLQNSDRLYRLLFTDVNLKIYETVKVIQNSSITQGGDDK